ncbi:uncharacterized protein LOC143368879 [Andrena cerasifolii]|uniref:uncharacterized protein LOC143368879 n=1 Tax=Andrena cerasifolii TaxID=2819439 RepID=UPI0040382317
MQVHVKLLAIAVILVATESKPLWPDLYVSNYHYPSEAISLQPEVLQYQDTLSPYYFNNVHTEVSGVPAAVVTDVKSAVSHLPAYSFYYGTPIYDLRLPLSPVYPALKPCKPDEAPKSKPPSTTTTEPSKEKGDGIEKLDAKAEPEKETKKPDLVQDNAEDDSVSIESR